jgi:hypothetical protein
MTFAVTNTTLTNPADKSEIETNFTDVVNKINGNLDNTSIGSGAAIDTGKLSARDYEVVLTLVLNGTDLNALNTHFFVVGGIPYDSTAGTGYTILGVEHLLYIGPGGGGGTALVGDLKVGNHNDGFTNIKTGISTGTANGETVESGFTTTYTLDSARPEFFIFDVTTAGVGFAAGDSWALSIKIKRTAGLR